MMDFVLARIYFFLVLIALTGIGWVYLFRQAGRIIERESFANEFLQKFRQYVNSRGQDGEAYGTMIYHSAKMQRELGSLGVMVKYKPPFANYFINDYPVILNMLPELHRTTGDDLMGNTALSYAQTLEEVLIRHLGIINEQRETIRKLLRNPLAAFREGVQLVLMLPLFLLHWLGVVASSTIRHWSSSVIIKFVAGTVSVVGFVSAIIGIVVGWSDFVMIVRRLFHL
jgi:hypothetical protein